MKCLAWLGLLVLLATPALSFEVPDDFQEQLVAEGFDAAVGLSFLPDGRALIIDLYGEVILLAAAQDARATQITIPGVHTSGEAGLLGVAVDPDWPARPFVYFHYNRASPRNVALRRYTATRDLEDPAGLDLGLTDPVSILDDLRDVSDFHNGGGLRFGPDGMLYMGLGDDAPGTIGNDEARCAAQDSTQLVGVMLRLDVSRLPRDLEDPPRRETITPPDNPWASDTTDAALVFAMGLRNPFRFGIDPVTGGVYIADVGNFMADELDEAFGGENFGWPFWEGGELVAPDQCGGVDIEQDPPIQCVPRDGGRYPGPRSIVGGEVYRSNCGRHAFPPEYDGVVFYGDFYGYFIRAVKKTACGWDFLENVSGQSDSTDWAVGICDLERLPPCRQRIGDLVQGPDGALYYTDMGQQQLRRIVYLPAHDFELPTLARLSAYPNPVSQSEAVVRFQRCLTQAGALDIVSASGRTVRRLETESWDLKDSRGRRVAPGVYWARIRWNQAISTATKIVVLP